MEMREEHGVDLGAGDIGAGEPRPGARPGIDHHHAAARDHRGAGIRPRHVRHWRAGAAQENVQAIVGEVGRAGGLPDLPRHGALHDAVLHRRHEPHERECAERAPRPRRQARSQPASSTFSPQLTPRRDYTSNPSLFVMAGLVRPSTSVHRSRQTRMPGTRPGMTAACGFAKPSPQKPHAKPR